MISFDAEAVTQLEQERALTTLKMLHLAQQPTTEEMDTLIGQSNLAAGSGCICKDSTAIFSADESVIR